MKSPLAEKSFALALEVVKLGKRLKMMREFDFASQLFRSGTSIGANVEEAIGAQSHKDFIAKISIAHKESREVRYWLRLLKESEIFGEEYLNLADSLLTEISAMIVKCLKTAKMRLE